MYKKVILLVFVTLLFISCGGNETKKAEKTSNADVEKQVMKVCSNAVNSVATDESEATAEAIKDRSLSYLKNLIKGLKTVDVVDNPEMKKELDEKIEYTQEYLDGLEELHKKYESNGEDYFINVKFISESTELAKKLNVQLAGNKVEEYCTFSNEDLAEE